LTEFCYTQPSPRRAPPCGAAAEDAVVCKSCGTEIADKALICYRCGAATSAPAVPPPAPTRAGRAGLLPTLALVALALLALFMGQAGTVSLAPEVRYAMVAVALVILVWRLLSRRR